MTEICKCNRLKVNHPSETCKKFEAVEVCENIKEGRFWEDKEWRAKELKKMERNIKAAAKRQGEAEVRKFNEYLKLGRRTY